MYSMIRQCTYSFWNSEATLLTMIMHFPMFFHRSFAWNWRGYFYAASYLDSTLKVKTAEVWLWSLDVLNYWSHIPAKYKQRYTVCCNSIVRNITFCFLPSISPSGSVSSHPWPDLGAPLPVLTPPEAPLLLRLDGLLTDPDDRLLSPNDPLWPLRLPTEPRVPLAPPCLNALPTDRLVPLALLDLKAFSIEADLWSMLVRWAPVAAAALPTPVLWSRVPVLCFTLFVRRGQDSLTLLPGI